MAWQERVKVKLMHNGFCLDKCTKNHLNIECCNPLLSYSKNNI